ncbi:alpha/beta fold hydrolase [Defluviicoccus vanus]|uniref:alpha/beta fold hydrolase n=1 Tax=Defluviicoccus vanus TaxID=111831 RepID=UPI001CBA5E2D|nr:alpha/beta fold hydrolase [Defluviicoccus vanus]
MPMQEKRVLGLSAHGFYTMAYFEWGDPENDNVLVCVHGLTRRGRDFDALARALEDRYRVVCVDLPGRGQSDWFSVAADYQPATYLQGMAAVLARLNVAQVDWLGVSLGGLIGMMLAAQPKTPIRKLVLDDIGSYVDAEALQRIAGYVSEYPAFADRAALEAYVRVVCAPYGLTSDAEWAHLITYGSRQDETGAWRFHYDPKLAEPFKEGFSEPVSLWTVVGDDPGAGVAAARQRVRHSQCRNRRRNGQPQANHEVGRVSWCRPCADAHEQSADQRGARLAPRLGRMRWPAFAAAIFAALCSPLPPDTQS